MPLTSRKRPPDHGGQEANDGGPAPKTVVNTSTQTDNPLLPPGHKRARCGWKTVVVISLMVAVVAAIAGRVVSRLIHNRYVMEDMQLSVGEEGLNVFRAYDRDGDGYLNVIEFEPLLERLDMIDETEKGDFKYGDEDIDPAEEVLTVEAAFQPLRQETMSKTKDMSFLSSRSSLTTLDRWKEPTEKVTAFPSSTFRSFLPDGGTLAVGKPYFVVKSKLNMFTNQLSSNRYYPPRVNGKAVLIHRLLSLFHPRPFVYSRFGPQGTVALIRAQNADYVDIVFRIHAEFQLNEPPNHPFWFTPAQFTGQIVMRKDASHIEHFHMYVPANKSLNVDMEWMNGPNEVEHMEVDIGYMPQMELTVPKPSSQVIIYAENGDILFQPSTPVEPLGRRQDITWDQEIGMEEALGLLEVEMYPFKKIEYLPLDQAFRKAQSSNRLVHHIMLWGSLDDQSC